MERSENNSCLPPDNCCDVWNQASFRNIGCTKRSPVYKTRLILVQKKAGDIPRERGFPRDLQTTIILIHKNVPPLTGVWGKGPQHLSERCPWKLPKRVIIGENIRQLRSEKNSCTTDHTSPKISRAEGVKKSNGMHKNTGKIEKSEPFR